MKTNLKRLFITTVITALVLTPAAQANPFKYYFNKACSLGYWAILALPMKNAFLGYQQQEKLTGKMIPNELQNPPKDPMCTTLQQHDPKKYAEIMDLAKNNDIDFNSQTIVLFNDQLEKRHDAKNISRNPHAAFSYQTGALGNNIIFIGSNALNNQSTALTTALLLTKKHRNDNNDVGKSFAVGGSASLLIGAAATIPSYFKKNSNQIPSIWRSLLKPVKAFPVVALGLVVSNLVSQQSERNADAALKPYPHLATTLAWHLEKSPKDEISADRPLLRLINKSLTPQLSRHERARRLRQWAQEAQAKQQK